MGSLFQAGCWPSLVGGLPCPFRASVPPVDPASLSGCPGSATRAQQQPRQPPMGPAHSHGTPPTATRHACRSRNVFVVSRVRVDGIRTAGSLPLSLCRPGKGKATWKWTAQHYGSGSGSVSTTAAVSVQPGCPGPAPGLLGAALDRQGSPGFPPHPLPDESGLWWCCCCGFRS